MITKFNDYIKEGVRDLMTPRSEEEIKRAYSNLVKSFDNPVTGMAVEWTPEFEKIADILGVSRQDLHAVVEDYHKQYELLSEYFDDLIVGEKEVVVKIPNYHDALGTEFEGGEYSCYPKQKLTKWSSEVFDNPHVWVFSKKHFDDLLTESIRDMMTPKSIEEILSSLGGNPDAKFFSVNKSATGTYLVGEIYTNYDKIAKLFGEPFEEYWIGNNFYWVVQSDNGHLLTIYDNNSGLEPEELMEIDYSWHIGGTDKQDGKDLIYYIYRNTL